MVKVIRPSIGPTRYYTQEELAEAQLPPPVDICVLYHYLSSSLYPVPQVDAMVFGVEINEGSLDPIPQMDLKHTFEALDGTLEQTRWFYYDGPYFMDLKHTFEALDGTLVQTRWFYYDGPYEMDLKHTFEALDGTLENKLVEADTPDEGLQMTLVINDTCTMDAV